MIPYTNKGEHSVWTYYYPGALWHSEILTDFELFLYRQKTLALFLSTTQQEPLLVFFSWDWTHYPLAQHLERWDLIECNDTQSRTAMFSGMSTNIPWQKKQRNGGTSETRTRHLRVNSRARCHCGTPASLTRFPNLNDSDKNNERTHELNTYFGFVQPSIKPPCLISCQQRIAHPVDATKSSSRLALPLLVCRGLVIVSSLPCVSSSHSWALWRVNSHLHAKKFMWLAARVLMLTCVISVVSHKAKFITIMVTCGTEHGQHESAELRITWFHNLSIHALYEYRGQNEGDWSCNSVYIQNFTLQTPANHRKIPSTNGQSIFTCFPVTYKLRSQSKTCTPFLGQSWRSSQIEILLTRSYHRDLEY